MLNGWRRKNRDHYWQSDEAGNCSEMIFLLRENEREKRQCTRGSMVESLSLYIYTKKGQEGRLSQNIYFHPFFFRLFLFLFPSFTLFLFVDRFSNFQRDQTLFSAHEKKSSCQTYNQLSPNWYWEVFRFARDITLPAEDFVFSPSFPTHWPFLLFHISPNFFQTIRGKEEKYIINF